MIVECTLPLPPSANHGYKNTPHSYRDKKGVLRQRSSRRPSDVAKDWMEEAAWLALRAGRREGWTCSENEKIVVEIKAFWPDGRKHDMNNLHKFLADALEGVVYDNDKYALLRDMDWSIDRAYPRLEIRWYPKREEQA